VFRAQGGARPVRNPDRILSRCWPFIVPYRRRAGIHSSFARALARSLARSRARTARIPINDVGSRPLPSPPAPFTRVRGLHAPLPARRGRGGGPRIRGELCLCARGREGPSRLVFRLVSRSKDRSSSPLVRKAGGGRRRRKKQRERERERERVAREIVYVSTKLDGFNLERAPLRVLPLLFSRLLHQRQRIQACVCVRTYTHVGSPHVHIRA